MTSDELKKNRYEIVFNALKCGLIIDYKHEWQLFSKDDVVYQKYTNPQNGNVVVHKSAITLSDFFSFIEELSPERLKRLFGDTRLIALQERLIKENLENNE